MTPRPTLLFAGLGAWILAATTTAALPIVHAIPQMKAYGHMGPLLAALFAGALVAIPASFLLQRLTGLGVPPHGHNPWGELSAAEASLAGILCWGIPVGIVFLTHEFQQSAQLIALVPNAVIWPLAGIAMGLLMRLLGRPRARSA